MVDNNISEKAGLPPGALIHIGNKKSNHSKITLIDYSRASIEELKCENVDSCIPFKDLSTVSWVNIDGLSEIDTIASIGNVFKLHPLLIEDVLNTKHRPKSDEFDGRLFFTLKMLGVGEDGNSIVSEQVSLVLGDNWLLTFQEEEGDVFESIRERIREGKGIIRDQGVDYLFYRLIDTIVDNYFFVTEYFSERIEALEERVLKSPEQETLYELQQLKKQLTSIRKTVSPLREALSNVYKEPSPLIKKETTRFLRDVYEHVIQLSDTIETQKDLLASIMDLYLSGVSNKMNQVMQVLTIISTIFIPLTFIAGLYGMNFKNMPELEWEYGYHGVLGLMVVLFIIMIFYFKRKKWL